MTFLVNSTALETNFSELKDPVAFLEKKTKKQKKSKYLKNTRLFLAKVLCNSNQNINRDIAKHINDVLVEIKIDINRKKS